MVRASSLLALLALSPAVAQAEAATSTASDRVAGAASTWVVGRAEGTVLVWTGTRAAPAVLGAPITGEVALEASGWCELWSSGDARLRLAAGTRVTSGTTVDVERGRAWLQLPASGDTLVMRSGRWHVEVPPGASVVVERSSAVGTTVAVRAGLAVVRAEAGAAPVVVRPGEVAHGAVPVLRAGGVGLLDLAASEAREARRDPTRLRSFLVERSARVVLGRLDTRTVGTILRVDPELAGGDGGSAGYTLEEALRPPPFYEAEVPTKGPNVEIVVEFAE